MPKIRVPIRRPIIPTPDLKISESIPMIAVAAEMSSSSPERRYKCDTCHQSFRRTEHLLRHELTHSGERPYPCSVCSRGFSRLDALQRHLRTHGGIPVTTVPKIEPRVHRPTERLTPPYKKRPSLHPIQTKKPTHRSTIITPPSPPLSTTSLYPPTPSPSFAPEPEPEPESVMVVERAQDLVDQIHSPVHILATTVIGNEDTDITPLLTKFKSYLPTPTSEFPPPFTFKFGEPIAGHMLPSLSFFKEDNASRKVRIQNLVN